MILSHFVELGGSAKLPLGNNCCCTLTYYQIIHYLQLLFADFGKQLENSRLDGKQASNPLHEHNNMAMVQAFWAIIPRFVRRALC
jgi:hypothetical protein